jgi:hypothetical protein
MSRKHAGRATSSLIAKYSFENGSATSPLSSFGLMNDIPSKSF